MQKNKKNRNIFLIFAVAFIILLLICILLSLIDKKHDEASYTDYTDTTISYNGKTYVKNSHTEAILIIGTDSIQASGNELNGQSDFLMLVVLNHEDKTIDMLQINRDTMTDIKTFG
ncbi:MAG: hypothetical protein ACI4EF_03175, partial [Coprococcus sp.]